MCFCGVLLGVLCTAGVAKNGLESHTESVLCGLPRSWVPPASPKRAKGCGPREREWRFGRRRMGSQAFWKTGLGLDSDAAHLFVAHNRKRILLMCAKASPTLTTLPLRHIRELCDRIFFGLLGATELSHFGIGPIRNKTEQQQQREHPQRGRDFVMELDRTGQCVLTWKEYRSR